MTIRVCILLFTITVLLLTVNYREPAQLLLVCLASSALGGPDRDVVGFPVAVLLATVCEVAICALVMGVYRLWGTSQCLVRVRGEKMSLQ